ncbi:biogenesis of lysosome-related organelles complex 1 subunit 6 [Diabrotica virgifera virgifera]|uniref:Biogenesis of lysosome-related organelles complex 1 subunit 6 n=1 Tax=Diabrotica virgifera virgifera TaxID=50390 RepID=A0A6P7G1N7_DIAVI|nr:biogenesis of lysosome-related organelles complex 1 subunit 6 [Diabrotica virgifera virgifera]
MGSASEINPYNDSVKNLSEGLLAIYKPALNNVQSQLKELTSKQTFLVTQIHQENLDLAEVQYSPEIQDMFKKMNLYHSKLTNIKKDMKQLHERSVKLKKRALKLQQIKEKEKLAKLQNELEIKRETELIGPGPSKSDNSKG